ncbi:hypothetical protein BMS3Bbin12_01450 [bacterium BMS3Bbin12]|nr:hypothetical protein BMS3Abin12_00179 [bacterium BMS3Abin12]GBE48273.1 hypothetical protein BMS3Bbin12_01450 [bacterium BMS3Bbin12]GBE50782.1 hypothetical protein BMS3Bbin13_01728 [bacterium BMS3Bbin13]
MGAGRTARVGRAGWAGPVLLGTPAALPSGCVALPVGGAAGDGCGVGEDRRGAGRIADDAAIAARVNARCVRGVPAR